jgi:hypothetical protein
MTIFAKWLTRAAMVPVVTTALSVLDYVGGVFDEAI